jgi:hypothetical protein
MLPLVAVCVLAADPAPVEFAGMKATPPAGWKQKELPPGSMRAAQFALPKADGDKEDADLALFVFPGGAGTPKQNLDRQLAKFLDSGRTVKDGKVPVGPVEATYQDITGTYKKKPFPMSQDFTPVSDYRQLYVLFEKDGKQYYLTLLGPKATVEKHRAAFEGWLKSFK